MPFNSNIVRINLRNTASTQLLSCAVRPASNGDASSILKAHKNYWLFLRRPGNLSRPGEAMFFLHEDSSMRRLAATGFVDEGDGCIVCRQRIKDRLSGLAAPDFDDVGSHVFVFPVTGADVHICPFDCDLISVARHASYRGRWVIGRLRQFCYSWINNRQT